MQSKRFWAWDQFWQYVILTMSHCHIVVEGLVESLLDPGESCWSSFLKTSMLLIGCLHIVINHKLVHCFISSDASMFCQQWFKFASRITFYSLNKFTQEWIFSSKESISIFIIILDRKVILQCLLCLVALPLSSFLSVLDKIIILYVPAGEQINTCRDLIQLNIALHTSNIYQKLLAWESCHICSESNN